MRLPLPKREHNATEDVDERDQLVCLVATSKEEIVGMASLTRFEGRRSHVGAVGMGVHDSTSEMDLNAFVDCVT